MEKYYYVYKEKGCQSELAMILRASDRFEVHKAIITFFPNVICATVGIDYYNNGFNLYIREDEELYLGRCI